MTHRIHHHRRTNWVAAGLVANPAANAALTPEELAGLAQNPVGNLIRLPFQYNANLNYGQEKGTQSVLNIQPVVPFEVSENWNAITRTIMSVVWQPAFARIDQGARARRRAAFGVSLPHQVRPLDLGRRRDRPGAHAFEPQAGRADAG